MLVSSDFGISYLFREPPTRPLTSVFFAEFFITLHPLLILDVTIPTKPKDPLPGLDFSSIFPDSVIPTEPTSIFPRGRPVQQLFSYPCPPEISLRDELYEMIHGESITAKSRWIAMETSPTRPSALDIYPEEEDDEE